MKKIFFLFLVVLTLTAHAGVKYSEFIDSQIQLVYKMNDANISQEEASKLVKEQEDMYEDAFYKLMADKSYYVNNLKDFSSKVFSLKKIISINKRAGNSYAVIRDEAQIKSYLIVRNINNMIKNVLIALDSNDIETFESKLNQLTAQNQKQLSVIVKNSSKYANILALQGSSKVLRAAQNNIKEFYALQDINNDMIAYLYKFENKMYRLNMFSKYHLIKPAVYINSLDIVQVFDRVLDSFGLSVIKLIIIFTLIFLIYLFRKLFYIVLEKYLLKSDFLNEYAEDILLRTRKSIEFLIIVININMVAYVYNDFSTVEFISRFFNIIYTMIVTYIVYIVINTVAALNLKKFEKDKTTVKGELINVGIKIINFFIFMIGFLFILYFAGVNLTAVLSGLGIGGFAVAFAAKDTISNFFGTLSILFSDVFSQGDWIEIDGREGTVVEIGLRVTTIRTFDNALIAIPNGTFASKDIKNWNKRKLGRRIKMKLGVKYDSKREDIKKAIEEIREMLKNHPDIATKETKYEHVAGRRGHVAKLVSKDDLEGIKRILLVYLDEFSDSSINILVYCFSKSVMWEDWLRTKQDVMDKIMEIFEQNNLEFAFPSLSIYDETKRAENS
ncbi:MULTISPECIES: mechanosensitive ion channel family protein [Sulfurimonas]|uniref:mechanosensitive ion channel family protein n=1 Tax=Sulfurimonas TaxID=202746 RepID=UPI00165EFC97|nr:mechanosensitive ion channel family protein [Sulfurimonas indica]